MPWPQERSRVVAALGVAQLIGWGTSFYFPGVLAAPIAADTGWPLSTIVGGVSLGLLVAGLISPQVGRIIGARGGRPVLATSALLYAAGLSIIGLAPALWVYLIGWIAVGAAMGTGLYDAAFAALGRLYGASARGPITALTLFGGFASTVFWPLGAFLAAALGWRNACFVYAALHLLVALPLVLTFPTGKAASPDGAVKTAAPVAIAPRAGESRIIVLLALILTLSAGIGSIVVVHLLLMLEARGLAVAVAVSIGTLFGPAQVGARIIEGLFGARYHPIWTMVASCAAMALGLAAMTAATGIGILTAAMIVYAAGYGIMWIARGTVPLALFGAERYPVLMGRLAFPSLIVQALAPFAAALAVERYGIEAMVAGLTAIAAVNAVLILALFRLCRARDAA
ncbi:MAG: MFS transporter [Xanthobacteraceae bacterium]|nr:MFS transporter [Xanthobacteraceae bacterium]